MKNGKYGISDVAEMLGVSKSTVSRVINGNEGVGPELRKKVMDFINEIGYQPNTIAQSLSKGRMNIVALILGDIRNPFYADLTFNIQRILNDNGYMVMVLNSEYNIDRELEFLKLTEQFNFAGLILITAQEKAIEERLKNMEMPKVLVNRILPYYTGDSVLIDNFQAGYQATMHLIELGHRHIGFVKGPGVSSASSQRFAGYRQVLENYGFSFDEVNDMTAIGFMDGCRKAGIRIPEDLSIISFDDIAMASMYGIELTTISQHVDEMGEKAAHLMLKQLNDKDAKTERIIMEPTLIIRKTTCECSEN